MELVAIYFLGRGWGWGVEMSINEWPMRFVWNYWCVCWETFFVSVLQKNFVLMTFCIKDSRFNRNINLSAGKKKKRNQST